MFRSDLARAEQHVVFIDPRYFGADELPGGRTFTISYANAIKNVDPAAAPLCSFETFQEDSTAPRLLRTSVALGCFEYSVFS